MVRKYWNGSWVQVKSSKALDYWNRLSPNAKTALLFVPPGGALYASVHILYRSGHAIVRYMNGSDSSREVELPDNPEDVGVRQSPESDLKDIVDSEE